MFWLKKNVHLKVKVCVRRLFYFTKYLPENLEITTENDKVRIEFSWIMAYIFG